MVTALATRFFRSLPDFEGDRLAATARDPRVQRAEVISDAAFTGRYPVAWGSAVELTLRSGEVLTGETFAASGDPEKPLDQDELKAKIRGEFVYAGLDETAARGTDQRHRSTAQGGTHPRVSLEWASQRCTLIFLTGTTRRRTAMSKAQNYINGKWVDGSLGTMDMINPSHDTVIGQIARSDHRDCGRGRCRCPRRL